MQNFSYLVSTNEFVFHDNEEFISYQLRFFEDANGDICESTSGTPVLAPSSECDFVHMTFMKSNSSYKLINSRAFFFKGYKEIIIQGDRSDFDGQTPVIEVYDEMKTGAIAFYDATGRECHSYNHDDAIFNIQNEHSCRVSLTISDIELRVDFALYNVEHKLLYNRWYCNTIQPVFIKVYEAESIKMFNVKMFSKYLNLTHVFLHWCENIEITNCEFANYNARITGGNLWLWETCKNVNIVNNVFRKYGNDEDIAIWASATINKNEDNCYKGNIFGINNHEFASRCVALENVVIKGNRFYYGKPGVNSGLNNRINSQNDYIEVDEDYEVLVDDMITPSVPLDPVVFPDYVKTTQFSEEQWDGANDVLYAIYVEQGAYRAINQESTQKTPYVHYALSNLLIVENEYYIDSPANTLISLTLDDYCETSNIVIRDNMIMHGPWEKEEVVLQDFKVIYDKTGENVEDTNLESNKMNLNPVEIVNNTIKSLALPYVNGEEQHIVLNVENASVMFENNSIIADASLANVGDNGNLIIEDQKKLGVRLLYSREKGGRVKLSNNLVKGILQMASFRFGSNNDFSRLHLQAMGNTFIGNSCSIFENLQEGLFDLSGNLFVTNNAVLLFNGLPAQSIVVMKENVFNLTDYQEATQACLYYPNDIDRISPVSSFMCYKNVYYNRVFSNTLYPNDFNISVTKINEQLIN